MKANAILKYYNSPETVRPALLIIKYEVAKLKHAGAATLASLEPMLDQVRREELLHERTPGAFYLKSSGFLHFHEDPAGIYADLKIDGKFQRFPVTTPSEQQAFIEKFRELMQSYK